MDTLNNRGLRSIALAAATAILMPAALMLGGRVEAAEPATGVCQIYTPTSPNVPKVISNRLKESGDVAADICVDSKGRITSYATVSPIQRSLLGVCIFRIGVPQGSFANHPIQRPTFHMLSGAQDCPPQGDPAYVLVVDASEGILVSLQDFVRRISAGNDAFVNSLQIRKHNEVSATEIDLLRSDLSTDGRCAVTSVALSELMLSAADYGYQVVIGCPDSRRTWVLVVDLTPEGFRIFGFGRTID